MNHRRRLLCVVVAALMTSGAVSAARADDVQPDTRGGQVRNTTHTTQWFQIPIHDGPNSIRACRVLPADFDPEREYPVVLEWTNYSIDNRDAGGPTPHGCPPQFGELAQTLVGADAEPFVFVAANTLGVARSSGKGADQWSVANGRDGVEVLRWLDAQTWSSDQLGLIGCSSSAMEGQQVLVEAGGETDGNGGELLDAAVMACFAVDSYRGAFYPGGIRNWTVWTYNARWSHDTDYQHGQAGEEGQRGEITWAERLLSDEVVAANAVANRLDGPFWQNQSTDERYHERTTPVYAYVAWSDFFGRGGPEFAMRHFDEDLGDRMLFHPGWHDGRDQLGAGFRMSDRAASWFRHHLNGAPDPLVGEEPILYWTQDGGFRPGQESDVTSLAGFGQTNVWPPGDVTFEQWPLQVGGPAGGTLLAPGSAATSDAVSSLGASYVTPLTTGASTSDPRGFDQPPRHPATLDDAGAAAVTFVSPALPPGEHLTLAGPINLRIHASTTTADTDFMVRLVNVHADGSFQEITNGWLKASHAGTFNRAKSLYEGSTLIRPWYDHDAQTLVVPGEIRPYDIEVWQTATRLGPGDRLKVWISGNSDPWFLQEVGPGVTTIYADADHPSALTLPVLR